MPAVMADDEGASKCSVLVLWQEWATRGKGSGGVRRTKVVCVCVVGVGGGGWAGWGLGGVGGGGWGVGGGGLQVTDTFFGVTSSTAHSIQNATCNAVTSACQLLHEHSSSSAELHVSACHTMQAMATSRGLSAWHLESCACSRKQVWATLACRNRSAAPTHQRHQLQLTRKAVASANSLFPLSSVLIGGVSAKYDTGAVATAATAAVGCSETTSAIASGALLMVDT